MAVNEQKTQTTRKNGNFFSRVLREIKAEIKRITWPERENVKKATKSVLLFTIFFAVLIGLLDLGLNNLYKLIFK
ncbi:preprotein translocase subunit SecE [Clostridium cellulovorans]|uniref:Protein translocase subunit SecE n=1 Tax=Clostridium cellulovorans (strain ATCC 35296 / DSM 3052 / OCM 3 / 743B) TaxID=573061 RepID=D9SXB4_CLOC7|nr:preprotein translocase subunit SecE [Clostridium cellulovorans]ADL53417.1 preprotein translocase, SecE subunit [Clostridium cellulovorans 743B]